MRIGGRPDSGETSLHHALAKRVMDPEHVECVRLLLEAGADANRRTEMRVTSINFGGGVPTVGETPLMWAGRHLREVPILRLL